MGWLLLIIAFTFLWLWWDGLGAREVARDKGKQLCDRAGVLFLDDTVFLKRLRFVIYKKQRAGVYRRFVFEFATDGEFRYQGYVDMFGHQVIGSEMEPYRI